jgi:CubicO group peptidase (beta-lactamase class C family)
LAGASLAASALVGRPSTALAGPAEPERQPAFPATDPYGLRVLDRRAKETKSDAVLLYHQGQKIYEYYSGKPKPIQLMSCTKSIASLAVGRAIADGKIKSIDQPVYEFYPEMKQGRKAAMTIRHLLSMTSGIQNSGVGAEVYSAPDYVRLALSAELISAPGAAYEYNNKAVNILSGIIHIATTLPLDLYVRDQFFQPMGIESWSWDRDDGGNASAMADLALFPEDFAKFGLLMSQAGNWDGKPLVPESWVAQSTAQSQSFDTQYGFLWWRWPKTSVGVLTEARVAEIIKAGVNADFAAALRRLAGTSYSSKFHWHNSLRSVYPGWNKVSLFSPGLLDTYASDAPIWRYSDFDGYGAVGYLGQYLVVFPERHLVALRMINPFEGYDYNENRFEDFVETVRALGI